MKARRTFESVVFELVSGLEDHTIALEQSEVRPEVSASGEELEAILVPELAQVSTALEKERLRLVRIAFGVALAAVIGTGIILVSVVGPFWSAPRELATIIAANSVILILGFFAMKVKAIIDNRARQILEFEIAVRLVGQIRDTHLRDQAVYELVKRGIPRAGESPAGQRI